MRIEVHTIPALGHINPQLAYVSQVYPKADVTVFCHPKNVQYIQSLGFTCQVYPEYDLSKMNNLNFYAGTDYVIDGILKIYPFLKQKWSETKPDLVISDFLAHWAIQNAHKNNITLITTFPVLIITPLGLIFKPKLLTKLGISALANLGSLLKLRSKLRLLCNDLNITNLNLFNLSSYTHGQAVSFTYKKLQPFLPPKLSKKIIYYPNIIFEAKNFPSVNFKTDLPKIYLSLGTLFNTNARLVNKIFKQLSKIPVEVIYSRGGSNMQLTNLPKNFQVVDFLNQEHVLKQADLAIIGGGMNTVRDCIRLNVPMLVRPMFFDQYIQADLVKKFGLGQSLGNKNSVLQMLSELNVYQENIQRFKDQS